MPETTTGNGATKARPRKSPSKASAKTTGNAEAAKAKFAKAIEEAKAGAQALGKEAHDRAGIYGEQLKGKSEDWQAQAKKYGDQAMVKATELATEGKAKTSEAIFGLGKIVSENATLIDDKLGTKYGDYARSAAKSLHDTAEKIDAKDVGQLGEDAKEFVRKSPGLAVGMAAVAGYMLARVFRGSKD